MKSKENCFSSLRQENRRQQLVESLQALLANDAANLEVLKSGSLWPSATEIAGLQKEKNHHKSRTNLPCSSEETAAIDPAPGTFRFPGKVELGWLGSNFLSFRNNFDRTNTCFSPTNPGSTSSNQDGSNYSNTIDYSLNMSASLLVHMGCCF